MVSSSRHASKKAASYPQKLFERRASALSSSSSNSNAGRRVITTTTLPRDGPTDGGRDEMPNGQWLSLPGALSGEVDQRIGLGNVTEASSPS